MKINLSNLKKIYGEKNVVNIPEYTINHGEILGLVGNNGAGKTTLFRMILDLLDRTEGDVSLEFVSTEKNSYSIDPHTSEDWKKTTGAYIDDSFLIDFLTPEEYFDFVARVNNICKEELDNKLQLYSQFMSDEILGQKKLIRDYSAGNKQKIGIIGALLNEPDLLILDEPFNFLDPSSQHILKQIITSYNERTHATVLISSHNLQHTIEISTRIALLEHGVIVKDLANINQSAANELETYFHV